MPTRNDGSASSFINQLFTLTLSRIEQMREQMIEAEAMSHAASSELDNLPYLPRVPRGATDDHGQPIPLQAIEQRVSLGRLQAYVNASAQLMREVLDEYDRLLDDIRRQRESRVADDPLTSRRKPRRPAPPRPQLLPELDDSDDDEDDSDNGGGSPGGSPLHASPAPGPSLQAGPLEPQPIHT